MRISLDHKELVDYLVSDAYNRSPDDENSWEILNPDGSRTGEAVVASAANLEAVIGVWWQSDWDPREDYQDYVLIFRDKRGLYCFKYTCAGYSSVTFEPERDFEFIPGGTLADLCRFSCSDRQREWVEPVIGRLMLEEGWSSDNESGKTTPVES